jgi:nicotinamidase-related amidase
MRALIVVDVQNDFCPGGALAVAGGDEIVAQINNRMADFDAVILTQDWHPAGHSSFASSHKADAFSSIEMPYGPQVLWPDHCVQGSFGAAFHKDLATDRAELILRKGYRPGIDSYSSLDWRRIIASLIQRWMLRGWALRSASTQPYAAPLIWADRWIKHGATWWQRK